MGCLNVTVELLRGDLRCAITEVCMLRKVDGMLTAENGDKIVTDKGEYIRVLDKD